MPNHGMTPHYSGTTLDAQVLLFSLTPVLHAIGMVADCCHGDDGDYASFYATNLGIRICKCGFFTHQGKNNWNEPVSGHLQMLAILTPW